MQKQNVGSVTVECRKYRIVEMKTRVQKTQMQNVELQKLELQTQQKIRITELKFKNSRTKIRMQKIQKKIDRKINSLPPHLKCILSPM